MNIYWEKELETDIVRIFILGLMDLVCIEKETENPASEILDSIKFLLLCFELL